MPSIFIRASDLPKRDEDEPTFEEMMDVERIYEARVTLDRERVTIEVEGNARWEGVKRLALIMEPNCKRIRVIDHSPGRHQKLWKKNGKQFQLIRGKARK